MNCTTTKKWIVSDLHYSHKNICKGTSSWSNIENSRSVRDFKTIEEMNNAIVRSINLVVEQDDELYFLGDWSFGGVENVFKLWSRLICKNIYFIPGNHDQHIKKNKPIPNEECLLENMQDLFTMLPELYSMIYKGYKFIMSHYPIEEWEDMDRGSYMIHGHTHHTLDNSEKNTKFRRKDVGWDGRVYSFDEIVEEMETREIAKHI